MTKIEQRSRTVTGTPTGTGPRLTATGVVGIEMWERFSFYGMQAILVYHLYFSRADGGLGLDTTHATALMGAYGAFLYLCTIIGGWVGDRVIGPERTLLGGAITLVLGHLTMAALGGAAGAITGLLLVAVGSGALKTAAITVLGVAYPPMRRDRDAAFQIFYFGINVGALLGPILTGWLADAHGFPAGFAAATGLMAVGLAGYLVLRPRMLGALDHASVDLITTPSAPLPVRHVLRVGLLAAVVLVLVVAALATGLLSPAGLTTGILLVTALSAGAMFVTAYRHPGTTAEEKPRVIAFIPLFLCSVAFWALQSQIYSVLAVYSDLRLNRMIGDFLVPAAWMQSLNPFYILVFSVPLAWLWIALGDRSPTGRTKMPVGLAISASSMLVLIPFAGGGENSTPILVYVLAVLLISFGEMFIGPVGMAETSRHAPRGFITQFSALYFLSLALGTSLSGSLSVFYDPSSATAERVYFLSAFALAAAIAVGCGLWAARKPR